MSSSVLRKFLTVPMRGISLPSSTITTKYLPSTALFQNQAYVFSSTMAVDSVMEDQTPPKPISEMPGPRSFPILGSSVTMFFRKDFDTNRFNVMFGNMVKEYGPIFRVVVPGEPPMVVVSNVEDFEKMYKVTMSNPVRESFFSLKKVRYEAVDNYFEKKGGILTENGEEWWRVRRRIQTPMMRPKNLVKYLPQLDEIALTFMDRISDLQKKYGEMPSDFQAEMYKWALESVAFVALNRRLGCLEQDLPTNSPQIELIQTANNIFRVLNKLELGTPLWRLFKTPTYRELEKGHAIFAKMADSHVQEAEAMLMTKKNLQKEDVEQEATLLETFLQTEGLSRKDIVTTILDMLLAGIDTTSHSLGFTMYLLAKNKDAQRRLQEEVDSVLGNGQEPITESHLTRLSYLKACVRESMRLFPLVFGNARLLEVDSVFGGYLVPKGHAIVSLNMIACKNESLFPRAEEFLPERWGRDQPLGPIHPFAALPFSHGPRMCIGRRIAEQEMYVFLARAMQRFNIDYKYEDMDFFTRLVLVPSQPLRFEFTERR